MNTTSSCNQSKITEFLLVGFSAPRPLRELLFSICLVIYIMALGANLMIIALYLGSHHLRSPMYFFLSNLSATDISLSTTVGPNLLCTLLQDGNPMSVSACVTQFYAYCFFTGVECLLLTVMAYDRYLAICKPLHYVTIMTNKHCLHLVIWSWLEILIFSFSGTIMISHSGFCGCNTLDYVYCDFSPLAELSYANV
uniref:G-protein coupled receptors family 1 profile domain-containing protein n=1 Tax=Xenopus tropicalis TaxID=8364 RepID=A0A803J965_XENTR